MSSDLASKSPVFQLKASLYTLTTLHLLETNLEALNDQLTKLRQQAPKFFNSAPVIVDLQRLKFENPDQAFNFQRLKEISSHHQLVVIGLRHVSEALQASAKEAGFILLPNATQSKAAGGASTELPQAKPLSSKVEKKSEKIEKAEPATPKNSQPASATNQDITSSSAATMVINRSVRSGQQIYARNSDLVITGSVSPGAEVIADGNIHIYGQLQGRAVAGANGNADANIFCQKLAAELISIAGCYWLYEDVMKNAKGAGSNVRVFLEKDQLKLMPL
jgi:septum site-determining protein MinC